MEHDVATTKEPCLRAMPSKLCDNSKGTWPAWSASSKSAWRNEDVQEGKVRFFSRSVLSLFLSFEIVSATRPGKVVEVKVRRWRTRGVGK